MLRQLLTIATTSSPSPPSSPLPKMMLPSSQWVTRWWKWILETPASENPTYGYNYYTETPKTTNQPYDKEGVWFLAGAFNDGTMPHTHNQAYRSIMIPEGKSILFPVINFYGAIRNQKHTQELERRVKEEMDVINPNTLYVTIDGQQIPSSELFKNRVDTGIVFPITVNGKDNVVKMRHVLGRPIKLWAKGDGYWLFLEPLSAEKKQHDIHTFGSCLEGRIQIDIHYKVEVIEK